MIKKHYGAEKPLDARTLVHQNGLQCCNTLVTLSKMEYAFKSGEVFTEAETEALADTAEAGALLANGKQGVPRTKQR